MTSDHVYFQRKGGGKVFRLYVAIGLLWRLHTRRLDRTLHHLICEKMSDKLPKERNDADTWTFSPRHFPSYVVRRYHCKSFLISRRASLTHAGIAFEFVPSTDKIRCKQILSITRPSINCDFLFTCFFWSHLRPSLAEILLLSYANGFLVLNVR